MTKSIPVANFQFVNATFTNPRAPEDKAMRALIRKHAMRQVSAARRQQGNYGKHNIGQYPVFYQESTSKSPVKSPRPQRSHKEKDFSLCEEQECLHSEGKCARQDCRPQLDSSRLQTFLERLSFRSGLHPVLSQQGYEAAVIAYNFDVVDLSALASLHLGRCAGETLSEDPTQLIRLLRYKQWSYLTYLPSRYMYSTCLKDAVNCIIARVRQILTPNDWGIRSKVIPLYVKALNSLQKALDSPAQCYEPEVLCAIEILALYELLNPSGTAEWIRHAAGAAHVIQLRGPEGYSTDFEKALLMAHISPIMTETMLNNERCFLEDAPWKVLLESLILDDSELSDRSEITLSLLILKSRVPGTFYEVTSVICHNDQPNNQMVERVAFSARKLLTDLNHWLCKSRDNLSLSHNTPTDLYGYEKRSEITSTYLSCSMIAARLLGAILAEERAIMEEEAQRYARQTLELERVSKPVSPHATLFLAQAVAVAHSIQTTAKEWAMDNCTEVASDRDTNTMIERWKFEHWCKILGRKVS